MKTVHNGQLIAWHISIFWGFSQHNNQLTCFNISSKSVFDGNTHN